MPPEIKVVPGEEEIPVEILEQSIVQIGAAMRKLNRSRLTRRAILVLIRDAIGSGVGMGQIEAVLDALNNLEYRYLKPKE